MKALLFPALLGLTGVGFAAPSYYTVSVQGHPIGFARSDSTRETFEGKPSVRSDWHAEFALDDSGTTMRVALDSQSWATPKGAPLKSIETEESAGRKNRTVIVYTPRNVHVRNEAAGHVTESTVACPRGPIVDDPMFAAASGKLPWGPYYAFDSDTLTFKKQTVVAKGRTLLEVHGKRVGTRLFEIQDDQGTDRVYTTIGGELVRMESQSGIRLEPAARDEALAVVRGTPKANLVTLSAIPATGLPANEVDLTRLHLTVEGRDLSSVASDENQSVSGTARRWTIDVHPVPFEGELSLAEAKAQRPEWTRPERYVSSDSPAILAAAQQAVGDARTVPEAAGRVQRWVNERMRYTNGIGVPRDAVEVLQSKQGVCRDYAVLTAAMLRSLGVPTKVATGLYAWDGALYGHAWVEVWDGTHWVGVDPTNLEPRFSARHLRLGHGTVGEAFDTVDLIHTKILVTNFREAPLARTTRSER